MSGRSIQEWIRESGAAARRVVVWRADGRSAEAMRAALARHDALIEQAVDRHHGVLVRPRGEGDSRFAVFSRATDAVAGGAAIQQALHAELWPVPTPLRVRMALHTGEADVREGDYYGSAVNRVGHMRGHFEHMRAAVRAAGGA